MTSLIGLFMSRRLFLSPVAIASCSPDAQYLVRRRNEYTNLGDEDCPEIGALTFHLHILLGNRIVFSGSQGRNESFFG